MRASFPRTTAGMTCRPIVIVTVTVTGMSNAKARPPEAV